MTCLMTTQYSDGPHSTFSQGVSRHCCTAVWKEELLAWVGVLGFRSFWECQWCWWADFSEDFTVATFSESTQWNSFLRWQSMKQLMNIQIYFFSINKIYELWRVGRIFKVHVNYWLEFAVLGMPQLHVEAF